MVTITILNTIIVVVVVLIHYELLYQLTVLIPRLNISHRFRIAVGVLGAIVAHILEIWIFAIAYYIMHHADRHGGFQGNFDGSILDAAYYSFTTYTTLGFGDIEPLGDVRYLTGLESLTGLVLITWSASFLFVEMQRYWGSGKDENE